jgi:hypothetical protein
LTLGPIERPRPAVAGFCHGVKNSCETEKSLGVGARKATTEGVLEGGITRGARETYRWRGTRMEV